ncbi:hypothetical protein [Sphingomonas profundi]|nr:hypothetical protein [Sphingomonas profundi]
MKSTHPIIATATTPHCAIRLARPGSGRGRHGVACGRPVVAF